MITEDRTARKPLVNGVKALNKYPNHSNIPVKRCTTIVKALERTNREELEWNCLAFEIDLIVKGNVIRAMRVQTGVICNNTATTESSQGLPVCSNHKKNELPDIRCACGSWLEIKKGKWGAYFNCINCGNINLKKGLELISNTKQKTDKSKATTIKSDDIGIIY